METAATSTVAGMQRAARAGFGKPFEIRKLSDLMAAEITGIDLAEPFDDATRDAIMDALVEHHILCFRDQHLTKEQQYDFTVRFGDLEGHVVRTWEGGKSPLVHTVSNLDKDGNPTESPYTQGNFFWHTDKSYHAVPSLATLLHAIELPPSGGSTQFTNMYAAYEALPQHMKDGIAGLHAEHSWDASRNNTFSRPATDEEKAERPPVVHPIVRTHPVTGRKLLYMGHHTSHIVELPYGEGRALLYQLLDFATLPHRTYTHHWKLGDLVMWDNRCLVHRGMRDFDMTKHRRVLHRTVLKGTVPY
jgi:taurine dioxygenase